MTPRLLIAMPVPEAIKARAMREFDLVLYPDRPLSPEELRAEADRLRPDALLISSRMPMPAATIEALPASVRTLATYSVGDDHIDKAAAEHRGISIVTTPDVLTDATADLTMLLLLGACRRAAEYTEIMKSGWGRSFGVNDMLGRHVGARTLGILGMGRIGRAVAARAHAFGMTILYHNRSRLPDDLELGAIYCESLDAMLPRVDILSLHAPGGARTRAIIDRNAIALLPPAAIIVNAARGQLIDEEALIDALQTGRLAAAGLDVFLNEPHIDPRFRLLPNVFLTPHVGSATIETREAMGHKALDGIARACRDRYSRGSNLSC